MRRVVRSVGLDGGVGRQVPLPSTPEPEAVGGGGGGGGMTGPPPVKMRNPNERTVAIERVVRRVQLCPLRATLPVGHAGCVLACVR